MTWNEFDAKANRLANFLLTRRITKGQRVGILLMNCLEWLLIYFGILKSGAMAVPLNFRYTPEEIRYCLDLADVDALLFGPEFTGRIEAICDRLPKVKTLLYVGEDCPSFAESYNNLVSYCSSKAPQIPPTCLTPNILPHKSPSAILNIAIGIIPMIAYMILTLTVSPSGMAIR